MEIVPYNAILGSPIYAMVATRADEPIDVQGWSIALNGSKTHNEVFEWYFGFQIMPWRQGYCFEWFLRCGLGGRCK